MKILHLYHDMMNLYGEYGNVRALTRMLEKNGIDYELDCLSVTDELRLSDYSFIYVGSGTESNQKHILQHLLAYREDLRQYIDSGKLLLMTGNSFEILGERLIDARGKEYGSLGLFSFTVKEQDRTRNTADAVFTMKDLEQPLVGFINKCSTIEGIHTPLFAVKMGLANEGQGGVEGIRHQNFFGTHLTGPVLIKNPYFLIYLTGLLLDCTKADRSIESARESSTGKIDGKVEISQAEAEGKVEKTGQAGAEGKVEKTDQAKPEGKATETGQVKAEGKATENGQPKQEPNLTAGGLNVSWLTHELAGYEVTLGELSKRMALNE